VPSPTSWISDEIRSPTVNVGLGAVVGAGRSGLFSLVLGFLIPLPLGRPPAERTDPATWARLLAGFQERGIAVLAEHPRCSEPALYGLYVRGRREVVVCQRGDRSDTLRHEGWHLVQSLCLSGRPWLDRDEVDRKLSRRDQRELAVLVAPDRWWREAEARVMAQLPPDAYLAVLDQACAPTHR
jgi:hypothetical protein